MVPRARVFTPSTVGASRCPTVNVHLIDGTYELFRHYYGAPAAKAADGAEVGAVRGVLSSILSLLGDGATHVAVATDHVIESFRNELWRSYKTGDGIEPDLVAQFHPLEAALSEMGVSVLPMVEFEADDGLAAAVAKAAADTRVERVLVCSPDKDLAQTVVGRRIVQFDRRAGVVRDEQGVREKFGVPPASIPDYLALSGDSADGYPGLPGWGAKSASTVLARYEHLEQIPPAASDWDVTVRGAARLAAGTERVSSPGVSLSGACHAADRCARIRVGRRDPLDWSATGIRGSLRSAGFTGPGSSGRSARREAPTRALRLVLTCHTHLPESAHGWLWFGCRICCMPG